MRPPKRLRISVEKLKLGKKVNRLTVRDLLKLFDAERRGAGKVETIKNTLDQLGLKTHPDFETAWIDGYITLSLKNPPLENSANGIEPDAGGDEFEELETDDGSPDGELADDQVEHFPHDDAFTSPEPNIPRMIENEESYDPTFRIGSLPAANKKPIVVDQSDTVNKAISIMLENDFSQLPVMQSERVVKGVITWKSIAEKLVLVPPPTMLVRDFRDESAKIVDADRTLFEAIGVIAEAGYVLIRHRDQTIKGPVTVSDLSLHLQALTEPFLLLREIELHVRMLIGNKINLSDLSILSTSGFRNQPPTSITELTFGEYIRLMQNPTTWEKLNLQIDKGTLISLLDKVRSIRNDVMHFDPDPMTQDELESLKRAVGFMQKLYKLLSSNVEGSQA